MKDRFKAAGLNVNCCRGCEKRGPVKDKIIRRRIARARMKVELVVLIKRCWRDRVEQKEEGIFW